MSRQAGLLVELPQVRYESAWELQRRLVARRRAEEIPDALLLLEHPPTYTIGRSGSREHVLMEDAAREAAGIELYEVDRGGDATYHGPGQIVGYAIVDLRSRGNDVRGHLRAIEEILIRTLAERGLVGERDNRYTGVWVNEKKVAAIGVKVTGGVTSHGFALNVDPDFTHWAGIIPCGIRDRGVTSMARLLGRAPTRRAVRRALIRHAGEVFGLRWRRPGAADLSRLTDGLLPRAEAA